MKAEVIRGLVIASDVDHFGASLLFLKSLLITSGYDGLFIDSIFSMMCHEERHIRLYPRAKPVCKRFIPCIILRLLKVERSQNLFKETFWEFDLGLMAGFKV